MLMILQKFYTKCIQECMTKVKRWEEKLQPSLTECKKSSFHDFKRYFDGCKTLFQMKSLKFVDSMAEREYRVKIKETLSRTRNKNMSFKGKKKEKWCSDTGHPGKEMFDVMCQVCYQESIYSEKNRPCIKTSPAFSEGVASPETNNDAVNFAQKGSCISLKSKERQLASKTIEFLKGKKRKISLTEYAARKR